MELNPAALQDLYRIGKLISTRKKGGIVIPHESGAVVIDLEVALQDLDTAVEFAETCTCCGRRRG